jgi:hypothetical protein
VTSNEGNVMDVRPWSAVAENDKPRRLAELGLSEGLLRRALDAGIREASACTAHNPANYPGMVVWGTTIRELRDELVPAAWGARDDRGFPTVAHPRGTHQIAVAAGTVDTGRRNAIPRTRRTKGKVTELAIEFNQLGLGDLESGSEYFAPTDGGEPIEQTWYLLHYRDDLADEVRLELSLPGEMKKGYITGWLERIILEPLAGAGDFPFGDDDPDDGPSLDISVTPRG